MAAFVLYLLDHVTLFPCGVLDNSQPLVEIKHNENKIVLPGIWISVDEVHC